MKKKIAGSAKELILSYNVDLGNPGGGVSRRTAIFQVEVHSSGTFLFNWEYTGFHAFFQSFGEAFIQQNFDHCS